MVRVDAAFGRRAVEDHGGRFRPDGRCRPGGRRSDQAMPGWTPALRTCQESRGESLRGGRRKPPSQERRQRASELAEGRVSDRGSFDARRAAPGGSVGGAFALDRSRRARRPDDAPPAGTLDEEDGSCRRGLAAGVLLRTMEASFALTGDAGLETGAANARFWIEGRRLLRVCHGSRGESLRGGRRKPPSQEKCNVHRNSPKGASATEGVSMPGAQRRAVRQGAHCLGPITKSSSS